MFYIHLMASKLQTFGGSDVSGTFSLPNNQNVVTLEPPLEQVRSESSSYVPNSRSDDMLDEVECISIKSGSSASKYDCIDEWKAPRYFEKKMDKKTKMIKKRAIGNSFERAEFLNKVLRERQ